MVTPEEFLTELERELLKADPMGRHAITMGYASLMRSREEAIRRGEEPEETNDQS